MQVEFELAVTLGKRGIFEEIWTRFLALNFVEQE